MTEDKDALLRKLQKIKNLAASEREVGNVDAAENFAAVLNKLLLEHKLSMSDVEFTRHLEDEPIDKSTIFWSEHGLPNKGKRIHWVELLASYVAHANNCQILVRPGSNILSLVGREVNRKIAEYTIVTLTRAAEKLSKAEYFKFYHKLKETGDQEQAKGYRQSFLLAFVKRIFERLALETRQATSGTSSGTALIRLNTERAQVQKWVETHTTGNASRMTGNRTGNQVGAEHGRKLADRLDIKGRGVNKSPDDRRIGG